MDVDLVSHVAADFAKAIDDRYFVSGYIFYLYGDRISWQSRSQPTIALSSMEAEYMVASFATQKELGINIQSPIIMLKNKGCI